VAFDSPAGSSRPTNHWLRSMDHLEAGVRDQPERLPGTDRVRVHGSNGPGGHRYNLVHAWAFLFVIGPTGGAALWIVIARGFR
jgi:hypothetical protein